MLTSLCFLIQESYIASKSIADHNDSDDDDCECNFQHDCVDHVDNYDNDDYDDDDAINR